VVEESKRNAAPDLTLGAEIGDFKNGMLCGHVGDNAVLAGSAPEEWVPLRPVRGAADDDPVAIVMFQSSNSIRPGQARK
jgi:hypothetical protein